MLMTKGQFALLTAALGLATMAGAGYFGYAHADAPSSKGSGSSGSALGGQGAGIGTGGAGGAPAGGATGAATGGAAASGDGNSPGSGSGPGTPASVPACTGTDIQVDESSGGGAAGHLSVVVDFTDVGGHACVLRGYPGASMLAQDGHSLLDAKRTLYGPAGGATGLSSPPRVVLQSGGVASAVIEWSDVPDGSQSCLSPVDLGVTPPNTKQTTTFPMSGQAQVCSEFEVHPVVSGAAGGNG
jgi:Protein of unknown function (DUF4232)